jgi:hypothetical protein
MNCSFKPQSWMPAHRKNNGSERVQQETRRQRTHSLHFAEGSWNINNAKASTTPFEISIRDEH